MAKKLEAPQVSTRQARAEDLPVLAVIERELAKLAFPEDPITDLSYHENKLRRALKAEPEGMVVITTSDDTDLVAWLWMTGKTALSTHERYGVIRSLYVRHDLRQQGLATALATYAQRYFVSRGIHRIVAKLHINSEAGERTLNKLGFKPLHITYQWRAPGE